MFNIENEVSRTPPLGTPPIRITEGKPILYTYGCALLENYIGEYFTYSVVNLETNKKITLSRRKTPLAPKDIEKTVERIRLSEVSGTARLEADRNYGTSITYSKSLEILNAVFKDVMPNYGYTVRKEQIALAAEVLQNIRDRKTILAEAEVGTGKTHAYLIAAILAKRGRLNDFWNRSFYPDMTYLDMAHMPIVIATSSIALQKAIIKDYIPELSQILMDYGITKKPLKAVLRKGREHYVCDRNLRSHYEIERDIGVRRVLSSLLKPSSTIDLAEVDGLTPYIKRKIKVPSRCSKHCPHSGSCRYTRFIDKAIEPTIDIQVTNHNYLIADAMHRSGGKFPLLPNYQVVIIDEAHKFLQAVRSMYGTELSNEAIPYMLEYLSTIRFAHRDTVRELRLLAKKLFDENRRLFREYAEKLTDDAEDDTERYCVEISNNSVRHLWNISSIAERLYKQIELSSVDERHLDRKAQTLWEIKQISESADVFSSFREHICWLEQPSGSSLTLCSVPKDLESRLYSDFWSRRVPTILTSGTLSAGGDFSHAKRTLGLSKPGIRVSETSKPSPFNHKENTLLYISENMPFPDGKNCNYIATITDEIERLIKASHGHCAVLFTSYDTMGRVFAALSARDLPFPLMRLERGTFTAIERFKKTPGAVLFASGALWEGIDIPGDALSMLIIVKLPFQVPDPIGEYEQTLYKDFNEYKTRVVVPEMLLKLKQGFGRLIRTETDTGCVVILDSRVSTRGAYRKQVLDTLPKCRVTSEIVDVEQFMKEKKPPEYFIS